ncbi:TRAP transporter small permease subunit [Candidatus Pelagibacter sp.]|jgi:TRAP-type mannitol/chloroaromatic compound transport system permease small subunit|nr:TRAP transporter small permease subunit [Candidatus Pelagibacter sp.]
MVDKNNLPIFLRVFSYSILAFTFIFLANNVLTIWFDWPGLKLLFSHYGLFGFKKLSTPLDGPVLNLCFIQLLFYLISFVAVIIYVFRSINQTLETDAKILTNITAYIIRSSFWAVLIVGIADFLISFLIVEKFAEPIFNEAIKINLIIPTFRITFIHFPLILISFVIGYFTRSVGFIWLAVLVVGSEFLIVLSRFIFQYEQAFQGDLVRFWYAALYLFASAYALMHEGHVRVDVLYTGFSERKKAWTNAIGSFVLGIPLCLIILFLGMGGKASIINGPVISFEITQQGSNGLYLLYLMAVYLAVFAVTMLIQFTSYFMSSSHKLLKN